jgi:hypothetical protein
VRVLLFLPLSQAPHSPCLAHRPAARMLGHRRPLSGVRCHAKAPRCSLLLPCNHPAHTVSSRCLHLARRASRTPIALTSATVPHFSNWRLAGERTTTLFGSAVSAQRRVGRFRPSMLLSAMDWADPDGPYGLSARHKSQAVGSMNVVALRQIQPSATQIHFQISKVCYSLNNS